MGKKCCKDSGAKVKRKDKKNINNSVNSFGTPSLSCIYTNTDSFLNKIDEFKNRFLCDEALPDFIAIAELVPKNLKYALSKVEINFNEYNFFQEIFQQVQKERIVIYVRKELNAVEIELRI